MRTFLVISNVMRTDGEFSLKDIPGTSGRADVIARAVTSAFLTSHGIREDVELYVVCLGPPDPAKTIRFIGSELKHLNPDERTTASLLQRALRATPNDSWTVSTPGIHVKRAGLELIDSLSRPFFLLSEDGGPFRQEGGTYVMGDHRGLTEEQMALMGSTGAERISLGPVSLHTDHCIVLIHNRLDTL